MKQMKKAVVRVVALALAGLMLLGGLAGIILGF